MRTVQNKSIVFRIPSEIKTLNSLQKLNGREPEKFMIPFFLLVFSSQFKAIIFSLVKGKPCKDFGVCHMFKVSLN